MIHIDQINKKMLIIDEEHQDVKNIELISKFYGIPKENIFADYDSIKFINKQEPLDIPEKNDENKFNIKDCVITKMDEDF